MTDDVVAPRAAATIAATVTAANRNMTGRLTPELGIRRKRRENLVCSLFNMTVLLCLTFSISAFELAFIGVNRVTRLSPTAPNVASLRRLVRFGEKLYSRATKYLGKC